MAGVPTTFRVPPRLKQQLYAHRKKSKLPMSRITIDAINEWLENHGADPLSGSERYDDRKQETNPEVESVGVHLPQAVKTAMSNAAEQRRNHNDRLWPDSSNAIACCALREYFETH